MRSSLVRFVDLEAYEQAGGHVIRDLFSGDQAEVQPVGDPELVLRLAQERLNELAEEVRAAKAWAWLEVSFDDDFEVRQRNCAAPTQRREPSAEPAHELGELQREEDEANERLEAIYAYDGADDEGAADTAERIEALEGIVQAKQMRIDAIEAQLAYCPSRVDGACRGAANGGPERRLRLQAQPDAP